MTTRMFFDFDGVLNPIPYQRKWIGPEGPVDPYSLEMLSAENWTIEKLDIDPTTYFAPDHTDTVTIQQLWSSSESTYAIRWNSELIERINALVDSGKAQFTWLTTWREQAPRLLAPRLGLNPDWESMHWQDRLSDYSQMGKAEALADWIEAGGTDPFVWIDDVATERFATATLPTTEKARKKDYRYSGQFVHPLLRHANPSLVLQTSTLFGISREQWNAVETFVNAQA